MKADAALALSGKQAEKPVEFPLPNGDKVPVLVRPITQLEEADAIQFAMTFAKGRGLDNPDYGSALFDIGHHAKIVSVATLDADSPKDAREPFFPSAEFVIEHYHPETVLYLYQHWKLWQDECSPLYRVKSPSELRDLTRKLAEDGDDFGFFSGLSPRTQAICARFTARLALSSPQLKSTASSPTAMAEA